MDFLPLLSTFCILVSAILVAFGWYFIKNGRKEAHKKAMATAASFAVLFFIIYISRTLLIGNTSFGGPDHIKPYYTSFLIFHIFLALTGVALGILTIFFARKGRLKKHRKIGPWTAVIWFISATTGVSVYLMLYVIWEPGPVTSMIDAILK
ncbi:DUF420 domain-containing protein [Alkalihalobacillus sp. AL-G]|nr:DUF420 domain-containing protein [Alkalihalobacillus sp. AL-G]WLD95317.1 DUF420 domain-containing protein [Alkalihalobacillus sp. AL-G]